MHMLDSRLLIFKLVKFWFEDCIISGFGSLRVRVRVQNSGLILGWFDLG